MKWIQFFAAKGVVAFLVLAAAAGAGAYVKTHYHAGEFGAALSQTFRGALSPDSLSPEKPAFEVRLAGQAAPPARKESRSGPEGTAAGAPPKGLSRAAASVGENRADGVVPNRVPASSAIPPAQPKTFAPSLASNLPLAASGLSSAEPSSSLSSVPPVESTPPAASPSVLSSESKDSSAPVGTGDSNLSAPSAPNPPPVVEPAPAASGIVVNEVMAGDEAGSDDEFIELYNPSGEAVSLAGWSLKKKSSTGSESSLVVASRFEGKSVPARGYFLLKNEASGMSTPPADVAWPHSYTLAYTNNAVTLYDASGAKASEISWTEIPKGKSFGVAADGSFAVLPAPSPKAHN